MKQRIITAILLVLVLVPFFYSKLVFENDIPLILLAIVLSIIGLTELIAAKENHHNLHAVVRFVMYIAMLYIAFNDVVMETIYHRAPLQVDIIPLLIIFIGLWMIIQNKFTVHDAGFVLFAIFYVGLSFLGLTHFLIHRIELLIYLLIVPVLTDTFAYFIGRAIGKHKLIPEVSPNKTIEGSVGGTIIATIGGAIYLMFVLDDVNLGVALGLSIGLSIIAQIGDLIASKMKRTFDIKDYGNLFPGHGGVLDRLDSLLFTSLTLYYILQLFPQLL